MPERILTVMAFDFGLKRLGVAIGQSLTHSANPVAIVPVDGQAPRWPLLEPIIKEWQPNQFVVGLPRYADGRLVSPLGEHIQTFAQTLEARYETPVAFIDERLSSHAAQERARDAGHRSKRIDDLAAVVILESWFRDALK